VFVNAVFCKSKVSITGKNLYTTISILLILYCVLAPSIFKKLALGNTGNVPKN
jgi:hypothetical protein